MSSLDRRAVFTGFLLAFAFMLVGYLLSLASVGLFAGTAAGSYIAARRTAGSGAAHGAAVAGLVLAAAAVAFVVAYLFGTGASVQSTTLLWVAAVMVVGTAVGLVAKQ
jgi:hypothetical protein